MTISSCFIRYLCVNILKVTTVILAYNHSAMKKIFLFLLILFSAFLTSAQTIDEHSHSPQPKVETNRKQREADKKKEKKKKEADKAVEKGKKRHMSYQDKATRRRMKKNKKKAEKWNRH
jgi:hypothetical protein